MHMTMCIHDYRVNVTPREGALTEAERRERWRFVVGLVTLVVGQPIAWFLMFVGVFMHFSPMGGGPPPGRQALQGLMIVGGVGLYVGLPMAAAWLCRRARWGPVGLLGVGAHSLVWISGAYAAPSDSDWLLAPAMLAIAVTAAVVLPWHGAEWAAARVAAGLAAGGVGVVAAAVLPGEVATLLALGILLAALAGIERAAMRSPTPWGQPTDGGAWEDAER